MNIKKLKLITSLLSAFFVISSTVYVSASELSKISLNKINPTLKVDSNLKNNNSKAYVDPTGKLPKFEAGKARLSTENNDTKVTKAIPENPLKDENSKNKTNYGDVSMALAAVENTSPSTALYVSLDAVNVGNIKANGEQRWYFTQVPSAGKLTAFMQTVANQNIDYDLHLFSYNPANGTITEIKNSAYGPMMDEQLSDIVNSGYYFICVNSYTGFDQVNPFAFILKYSSKYDTAEPDDNVNTRKVKAESTISLQQTIDNLYDIDWIEFTISQPSTVYLNLTNVGSANTYKVDIFNTQLQGLATFNKNTNNSFTINPGTYYARVRSEQGFDAQQNYNLFMNITPTSTFVAGSPDGKYIITKDANKKMYLNNNPVSFDWKREYQFNFPGGGYEYRSQEIYTVSTTEGLAAQYGSYTSNYTGTVNKVFNLSVQNAGYLYWYTYYPNGGPSTHDQANETLDFPVSLILNVDTGKVVDLNSMINFYYYNGIESSQFTPIN